MGKIDYNKELKIGDIFYSAYGYGGLLVDFWEIIKITDKSVMFAHIDFEVIQELEKWARWVKPLPGHYSVCNILSPISAGSDQYKEIVSLKEASKITKRLSSYLSSECYFKKGNFLSLKRYKEGEIIKQSWDYHLLR